MCVLTKVSLVSEEPHSKAVDITDSISRAAATSDGRETDENRSLFALAVQERCSCDVGPVSVRLEHTMGTCTSCVNSSLWDTFVIKVSNLNLLVTVHNESEG